MEKIYVAISVFEDLEDNGTRYYPGTIFPRKGLNVEKKRIEELLSGKNLQGKALIAQVKEIKSEETEKKVKTTKKSQKERKKDE